MDSTAISGLEGLKKYLQANDIDLFYLPSFDHNLCEYVPVDDSLRFYLTKFSGSVAEALVLPNGKLKLYVDGRYHEQADNECNHDYIEVIKVPFGKSLTLALKEDLPKSGTIGICAERTPYSLRTHFKVLKVESINEQKLYELINFKAPEYCGEIWEVPHFNESLQSSRLASCCGDNELAFINALDTLSWLSGLRAHHLPYQGTFRAYALASKDELHIFCDKILLSELKKYENTKRRIHLSKDFMAIASEFKNIDKLSWDERFSTYANLSLLNEAFSNEVINTDGDRFHEKWQAIKDEHELRAFESSFEKSDKALYDTLCWAIESSREDTKVSELSFRNKLEARYKELGAKTQSFRSICGIGANGSIIHFGAPSENNTFDSGKLFLVDSGAIYEEGYATDCTRTIVAKGQPNAVQKLHYTLVLKGLLSLTDYEFKEGTSGGELDELVRAPLKEHGLNFAHGTGHGVGVNVHEAGYSIRPGSTVPMMADTVGSIEPGFYEPGSHGIRIENIVITQKVPGKEGMLYFRPLVYVGYWYDLIDFDLLDSDELRKLKSYEDECAKRGRSFAKYCESSF